MSLCECKCGGEASPGKRFISGHNARVNTSMKKGKKLSKEAKEKAKETKRLNKLLKEGKIELPFCACGCGGRVTKLGNKYITGHNSRVDHPMSGVSRTPWNKGLTTETDDRVKKLGEKESKTKKDFFVSEEGQKWLDDNIRGENNHFYGKESPVKGLTKETSVRLRIAGEKISKTHIAFFQTDEGKKFAKERGKNKKEFFATDEGQRWLDENWRGENHPMFGKEPWNFGLTKETNEELRMMGKRQSKTLKAFYATDEGKLLAENHGLKMHKIMCEKFQDPEFVKMMVNSWKRKPTQPEKDINSIVQLLFPREYKYNGNYELGITIGRKVPDFVNVNGKKKAIDLFGDYWHDGEDPQVRIDLFKEYGWDLLVIWQHELEDKDAVIQKIVKFHGIKSDFVLTQKTLDTWIDKKEDKNEKTKR